MSRIAQLVSALCTGGVKWKALGDLGPIRRGRRFVKADMVQSGSPCNPYGELYTKYGTWATETHSYLDPALASRLRVAQPGDVIFVSTGETVADIGKAVAWLGNEDVVIHDALYAFRSELDPRYVAYFSQTREFHAQIRRNISSSKVSAISPENLRKVRIPAPPLEIQHEVVRILDQFTELEIELGAELKAELKARRRQYTHYRELLLTFPEATLPRVALGDVTAVLDSRRRPIKKANRHPGPYPYYGANGIQDWVDDFIFEGTYLLLGEDGSVVNIDGSPVVNWAEGRFWVNNHAHVLAEVPTRAVLRFIYHYLQVADVTAVAHGVPPKITQAEMRAIAIPIPPLEEQRRIVAILDKFDALVNDLSIGLPAELVARRKQYDYYRDRLLSFEEAA